MLEICLIKPCFWSPVRWGENPKLATQDQVELAERGGTIGRIAKVYYWPVVVFRVAKPLVQAIGMGNILHYNR